MNKAIIRGALLAAALCASQASYAAPGIPELPKIVLPTMPKIVLPTMPKIVLPTLPAVVKVVAAPTVAPVKPVVTIPVKPVLVTPPSLPSVAAFFTMVAKIGR